MLYILKAREGKEREESHSPDGVIYSDQRDQSQHAANIGASTPKCAAQACIFPTKNIDAK